MATRIKAALIIFVASAGILLLWHMSVATRSHGSEHLSNRVGRSTTIVPVTSVAAYTDVARPVGSTGARNRQKAPDINAQIADQLQAIRSGDVLVAAEQIYLTPKSRSLMLRAIQQQQTSLAKDYSTPELLLAAVFCSSLRIKSFNVESVEKFQDQTAIASVVFAAEGSDTLQREQIAYILVDGKWKRVVDDELTIRVLARLNAL